MLGYLPEDGTVFCEDPGVSGDPLDVGLAPHQEDHVTAGLALDQGVPASNTESEVLENAFVFSSS